MSSDYQKAPASVSQNLKPQPEPVRTIILVPILAVGAGLAAASLTMISPSLPTLTRIFGISETVLAFFQSGYLIGLAVPQLLFGAFFDRFGRRPPFIVGVLLFLIGSVTCMLAPSFAFLALGRILQAVGASAGMVTARALLRELFPESKAASIMGYLAVAIMIIPMGSPVLGGYLHTTYGWRASFAFLTLLAFVLLVASWIFIPKLATKTPLPARSNYRVYGELARSMAFRAYTLQIALVSSANQVFFGCAPFIAEAHFGLQPIEYGKYFAIPAFGYMIGNLFSGRVVQRVGIDTMVRYGVLIFCAMSAILLAIFFTGHLTALGLYCGMAVISFSHGMIMPGALAGSTGALKQSYGSAAGLAGFIQMSVGAIAVFVVMSLLTLGPIPVLGALFVTGTASFLGFWFFIRPGKYS